MLSVGMRVTNADSKALLIAMGMSLYHCRTFLS